MALVTSLIADGAPLEWCGPDAGFGGGTALTIAAQQGNRDAVKVLLEAGCDVKATANGKTALQIAMEKGHAEVVALLEKSK